LSSGLCIQGLKVQKAYIKRFLHTIDNISRLSSSVGNNLKKFWC
jgi:hypothetical protein